MKKFRVLSDLHIDYNHNSDYSLELNKDDIFTVIAGDTSGMNEIYYMYSSCEAIIISDFVDYKKISKLMGDNNLIELVYKQTKSNQQGCFSYNNQCINLFDYCISYKGEIKNGDKIFIKKFTPFSWIRNNISKGIVIAGNHIVYNQLHKPIEELKAMFSKEFPLDSDITFLDKEVNVMSKKVDDILFIGSTLYTNYELPVTDNIKGKDIFITPKEQIINMNMGFAMPKMSGGGMNDFVYGLTNDSKQFEDHNKTNSKLCRLNPKHYRHFFEETINAIKNIVENNANEKIVIVTHHCPSPRCISKHYIESNINASYVSDLEEFIITHPQIKCWVCGHVHHRANFHIGNCLCIMNPLGYCKYGEYRKNSYTYNWSPDVFVNTDDWSVSIKPHTNKEWDKTYNAYQEKLKYYSSVLI